MKFPDKDIHSLKLPGKKITVTAEHVMDNPLVFEITATVDGRTAKQRHTIGADNIGPTMSLDQLQAALDNYRQEVADQVAWEAAMAALLPQLQ